MMHSQTQTIDKPQPPIGILDSLSRGFELVAGNLWLLLIPLLLDLAIWGGPRMTLQPLFEPLNTIPEATPESPPYYEALRNDLRDSGIIDEEGKVVPPEFLTNNHYFPVLLVPHLFKWDSEAKPPPFDATPQLIEVESLWMFIGYGFLSLFLGGLLLCFYFVLIAEKVNEGEDKDEDEDDPKGSLIRLPFQYIQMMVFVIGWIVVGGAILFAFLTFGMVLSILSPFLRDLAVLMGLFILFRLGLYTIFTLHGLFLNKHNLLKSFFDSIRVVQWHNVQTTLMFAATLVLSTVLGQVWRFADSGSWFAPAAIAGNAFLTTGLITATFVFYKDRHRHWQETFALIRSGLEQRHAEIT